MSIQVGEEYMADAMICNIAGVQYFAGTTFKVVYVSPSAIDVEVDDGSITTFGPAVFVMLCSLIQPTLPMGNAQMTPTQGDVYKVHTAFSLPTRHFYVGDLLTVVTSAGSYVEVTISSAMSNDFISVRDLQTKCTLFSQAPLALPPEWAAANIESMSAVCECGQRGVSYAIHSDYCPLYIKIAKI